MAANQRQLCHPADTIAARSLRALRPRLHAGVNTGAMDWQTYLTDFHHTRAGITQAVLEVSRDPDGRNPYQWLAAAAVPGAVIDVACGNAALRPYLASRPYLGLDLAAAELADARRQRAQVARASAAALPLATASSTLVVCSMALMIVADLPSVLADMRRVLAPGGALIATIPGSRPLHGGDLPILAGLFAALGQRLRYPNDRQLSDPDVAFGAAGLQVVADESHRFAYPLTDAADADRFLASLYLPGVSDARYHLARRYLRSLTGHHTDLPIPIRRLRATTGPARC